MQNWLPENLYRYRSTNSEHFAEELQNLKENKVWLNFLDSQNDPFEGRLLYEPLPLDVFSQKLATLRKYCDKRFSGEDLLMDEVSQEEIDSHNLNAPLFHDQVRKMAIVASFSKTHLSTLMWGHYADQFRGICLQFEYDYFCDGNKHCDIVPVQYWSTHPPIFSAFDLYSELQLSSSIPNLKKPDEHANDISILAHEKVKLAATSKSSVWAYEEEFRMLSHEGVPGYYKLPFMKLSGVLFGERVSTPTYHQVISTLGANIRYAKMRLVPQTFSYSFDEIPHDVVQHLQQ